MAPIAQDRDGIGDAPDFIQPVRHEDDADAFTLQPLDLPKQVIDLMRRQRRRWLVQRDQPRVTHQRPRQFDQLLLRHG